MLCALPAAAAAAEVSGHHNFGPVTFVLGVLIIGAKAAGLLVERWGQPSVLGELLAGIVFGNLLAPLLPGAGAPFPADSPLLFLARFGGLILLFDVGLEADLRALARVGLSSLLVAIVGVIVPIALGWAAAAWWMPDAALSAHLFVGATLSATSVGITTRVLKDLGATQRVESQIILGAALIDDLLGLMVLAVLVGMVGSASGGPTPSFLAIGGIVVRAIAFLVLTVALGQYVVARPLLRLAARSGHPEIMLVIGLGICFALSFLAELVGLADIIGAFAAGLMLDPFGQGVRAREEDATLNELLHPLSSLFVPLFFVLMGAKVQLASLATPAALSFGVVLIACAVVGKLACAVGVLGTRVDRLAVAIGMIPRGEVGLIFAGIGVQTYIGTEPLLSQGEFAAVVLMVMVTTLAAPIALRWAFAR
jgi:Na+:H+ antiporter